MELTVGSLFSGIGGIDLGLERAGMVTRWFCEIDPHCRNVLARHWPGLPVYGDITAVDWGGVERVDVLAGGFPCQPVSVAGRALAQADERWLWGAFRDAIGALRPRYVLVENVPGLLQRGLGIVLGDLAELGYDAEWECIPAASVGAPHLRNRLWLVAYASSSRRWEVARGALGDEAADEGRSAHNDHQLDSHGQSDGTPTLAHTRSLRSVRQSQAASWDDANGDDAGREEEASRTGQRSRDVADATRIGRQPPRASRTGRHGPADGSGVLPDADSGRRESERVEGLLDSLRTPLGDDSDRRDRTLPDSDSGDAQGQLPQRHDPTDRRQPAERPPGLFGGAGPSGEWSPEPDVGRVAHGVPHRVDRLRSLGNAVVPQVVEWIGRRIVAFDEREVAA